MRSKIISMVILLFIFIIITLPLITSFERLRREYDGKYNNYIITIDVCHSVNLAQFTSDIYAIFDGQIYQGVKPPIAELIQDVKKDIQYIIEFIIDHPPKSMYFRFMI